MSLLQRVPAELRDQERWVVYKREHRAGDPKPTKTPYRAGDRQNGRASSTDRATWASFTTAVAATWADGPGFVFTADDPYLGIDFDGCRDPETGILTVEATAWVQRFESYTEASPSGTGVHVIVKARMPGDGHGRKNTVRHIEMYDRGRYFTITGNHIAGTPLAVNPRQAVVDELLAELFPPVAPAAAPPPFEPVDVDDHALLDRARRSQNGTAFADLWDGRWQDRYGSQSEADLALTGALMWWTGNDAGRVDRLFRMSGLMRPKWDRADYRESTFAKAASSDVYDPRRTATTLKRSERTPVVPGGVGDVTATALPLKGTQAPSPHPRAAAETATEPERTFAVTLGEFIDKPRPEVPALVADTDGRPLIARKSLVMLGARGGRGKTTLFVDWMVHLALGEDYLCFTTSKPVRILLVENEGPEEMFAEKIEARLRLLDAERRRLVRERVFVYTFDWGGFNLGDEGEMQRLVRFLREHPVDLVFGDPLDSLGIDGVGSPEDTRRFLGLMKQAGLNKTCAWWLNTHPRKEETKEAIDEIAGAWGGKPDTIMLLDLLPDDRSRVRFPKIRWAKRGTRASILLAYDADAATFEYVRDIEDEERDYLAEITTFLDDGEWRTAKEISAPAKGDDPGIGASDKTVKALLEQHPDRFVSRTGADAVAVGRSPQATVWQLMPPAETGERGAR